MLVGEGMGVRVGLGVGLAVGLGVGLAVGRGVGVAVGRGMRDLDQALAHTAFEIGVGQPERDAEFAGQRALRDPRVAPHGVQQAERNARFAVRTPQRHGRVFVQLPHPHMLASRNRLCS